MRNAVILLAIATFPLIGTTSSQAAGSATVPFFMFSAHVGASSPLRSVLEQYVTSADYLSTTAVKGNPNLAARVQKSHIYALPPSLSALQQQVGNCAAGLIIYDGEHWGATPQNEQADMPGSIASGQSITTSGGCTFGVAVDGQYAGLVPKTCGYSIDRGIHRSLDFRNIALYNIQAQRLLSDECVAQNGQNNYVQFVTALANEIHTKNPGTKVSAQLSFRYTPPDRMIAVINQLRGVVDGFYLAYPSNVGGVPCEYCSADNLGQVLSAIKKGS